MIVWIGEMEFVMWSLVINVMYLVCYVIYNVKDMLKVKVGFLLEKVYECFIL